MSVGIPEYRLPKKMLNHEIDNIRSLGVIFKLNTRIERSRQLCSKKVFKRYLLPLELIKARMKIPGEELEGVMDAVDFLQSDQSG